MVVGAARDDVEALVHQRLAESGGVLHDLLLIRLELRLQRLAEADGLGRDDVHQRAALHAGKDALVDRLGELLLAEDEAAARAAQRLMGGGGDDIGIRHRRGVQPRGHKARDVRHVHHIVGADLLCDFADPLDVDGAGVGRGAGDDQLRLRLERLLAERLVVDSLVLVGDAVVHDIVVEAGEIDRRAVGQVPAVRETHAEDGVARLQKRQIHGGVRLGARVGLHVRVLRAEQLAGALSRDLLHDVHIFAAVVVPAAGIALRIFIGQRRTHRGHNRLRDEVLARDQLNAVLLAGELFLHRLADDEVHLLDKINRLHLFYSLTFKILSLFYQTRRESATTESV